IEDVEAADVIRQETIDPAVLRLGEDALRRGEAAVVTLAAGAGSRWTGGAGTVKALHPFAKLRGSFRSFTEVHLAKSHRAGKRWGMYPAHVLTTSYVTHEPIRAALQRAKDFGYPGVLRLSAGRSIGLRLVPTLRDLKFAWEHMPQQQLEQRKQKVRDSVRQALIKWAVESGEASDYTDNLPTQCVHPVGHWYEVANLLLNGTLSELLEANGNLKYLMLHNIDTLGADLDPLWLGRHIESGNLLSFEVIPRRFEDRGGGLARVNGRLRLVEGLAFPREEDESRLSYYSSMTTWISIDALLSLFGLTRLALADEPMVKRRVRDLEARLPTYITLKDVKRRWGNAQEDVFPVTQFEKLWGDMSALPDLRVGFFLVQRERGQQLKDVAQLDAWVRDGSREYVESLCDFA
ncbi:MAG TPA: UTP--glucose-1-phosphate uridylyltransferase, partial [Polyangiaceae bacterium]